ncbi:MAG: CynX/NimT family MFS transporter [Candidatus Binataceae bacterium]
MDTTNGSPYRWVIEALLLFALLSQTLIWLAPAPILSPIIKDLGIDLASAGLMISIIALCIAIFALAGALVTQKFGALRSLIIGLWLLAIGSVLSGYAPNFLLLLACRVIEGIGFGLMISPPATLVMQWFGESEWPYMNTLNAVAPFLGLTAAFALTGPVFIALGRQWRSVMVVYGVFVGAIALLWSLLGRTHPSHVRTAEAHAADAGALPEVLRMRDIRVIAVALFCGLWVFQLYSTFLPIFFHTVRGMTLERSGSLTALIPFIGIFAAAGSGTASSWTGLRRPFMYPTQVLFAAGCLGAVTFTNVEAIRISLILIGVGSAALLPTLLTVVMELPGMTPTKAGAGLGAVWAAGYAGAFLSPVICGAMAARFGLATVMQGSLVFALVAIGGFFMVPETGRGRLALRPVTASHGGR